MKKVIILNHGLHISGVSRTLVNFANALVKNGYDVTIKIEINDFTLAKELSPKVKCSLFLDEPRPFGKQIKGFLRYYKNWVKKLLKLSPEEKYKKVVKDKYNIEIAFNRGAAANIISGSTNKNAKKLVWVHNNYMKNDNPLAGFSNLEDAQLGYSKYDHIVCVSMDAEESFKERFGDDFPLVTRYNIMDTERITELAREKSFKKQCFTIVCVGRLSEQKNYTLLMDSLKLLCEKGYLFECIIVGGGYLEQELLKYRNNLGLSCVKFIGLKTNPYAYMGNADLYVSSSIYEGLSTTTIEAIILGKPCVVTNCAGMKEILGNNNEYGMVVPIEKNALADAIETMMTNNTIRKEYELKALEGAKRFQPEKLFESIEELFI